MEKLRLDVDALRVDGFATVSPEAKRIGTVKANEEGTIYTNCTTDCTDITSCGHPCP